jgi:hypothetical protein
MMQAEVHVSKFQGSGYDLNDIFTAFAVDKGMHEAASLSMVLECYGIGSSEMTLTHSTTACMSLCMDWTAIKASFVAFSKAGVEILRFHPQYHTHTCVSQLK